MSEPRAFSIPWTDSPDLDIHPSPKRGWHRIAVVGLWTPAQALRKRYPEAAVCGPLRTLRGVDLLVRSLLANPQIRVLLLEGREPPGGKVEALLRRALPAPPRALEDLEVERIGEDLWPHLGHLRQTTHVFGSGERNLDIWTRICAQNYLDREFQVDLPPPAPIPSTRAPAGDPGERIVADTVAELWPRLLDRALTCGVDLPEPGALTTRELRTLVSVVRNPRASMEWARRGLTYGASTRVDSGLAEHDEDPVLGLSWAQVSAYHERISTAWVPEGTPYSYGSRMGGGPPPSLMERLAPESEAVRELSDLAGHVFGEAFGPPDQHAFLRAALRSRPMTRAAYLTPWRPEEDAVAGRSGQPCLVGVQLRAVPTGCGDPACNGCGRCTDEGGSVIPHGHILHMQVSFRSHDLFGGWPLNLSGFCLWLCELADELAMSVGQLTCVSLSAHLYEHDLRAAQEVVEKARPAPWIAWDSRSSVLVERHDEGLRATVLTPDGADVIFVAEGSLAKVQVDLQRSGFITSIGHALWIGSELQRALASGGPG